MTTPLPAATALLALASAAARADEGAFRLQDGPGVDEVRQNCNARRSLVCIRMKSRFLDHKAGRPWCSR